MPGTILLAMIFAFPMTLMARIIFSEGISNIVASIVTGYALPFAASKVAPVYKRATALITGITSAAAVLILVGAVLATKLANDGALTGDFWVFIVYAVLTLVGIAIGVVSGMDDADN